MKKAPQTLKGKMIGFLFLFAPRLCTLASNITLTLVLLLPLENSRQIYFSPLGVIWCLFSLSSQHQNQEFYLTSPSTFSLWTSLHPLETRSPFSFGRWSLKSVPLLTLFGLIIIIIYKLITWPMLQGQWQLWNIRFVMTMIINAFGFSGQNRPTVDTLAWNAIIYKVRLHWWLAWLPKGFPWVNFQAIKWTLFAWQIIIFQ